MEGVHIYFQMVAVIFVLLWNNDVDNEDLICIEAETHSGFLVSDPTLAYH